MEGGGNPWLWLRVALVVFVLAWILGPSVLRDTVPIFVVFLIALGLEIQFLVSALRSPSTRTPDRSPQQIDRERYGFPPEEDEFDERCGWSRGRRRRSAGSRSVSP